MKQYKKIFLFIAWTTYFTNHCMQNKGTLCTSHKTHTMIHFLATQKKLKQEVKKKYKKNTQIRSRTQQSLAKLPKDIQLLIAAKTFHEPPWWYCNKEMEFTQSCIYALSSDPDSNTIAIGLINEIKCINLQTMETIISIDTPYDVCSLAYNHSGNYLGYGLFDGTIAILKTKSLSQKTPTCIFSRNIQKPIWSMSFSPDDRYVAIGSESKRRKNIQIFDIIKKKRALTATVQSYVYGMFFTTNDIVTCCLSDNRIINIDIETKKRLYYYLPYNWEPPSYNLWATSYSLNNNMYCLSYRNKKNNNNKVYLINKLSKKTLASFKIVDSAYAITLQNQYFVVGLSSGKLLLFTPYLNPTPKQSLLKSILFLWLQLEKPNKAISSPEDLLTTLQRKLRLNKDELTRVWNSLPTPVSDSLWNRMNILIQRYGK